MTEPIVKETVELYPERCELPSLNYTITKFSVKAQPSELETEIVLSLNDVVAATLSVPVNSASTKASTFSVNTKFRLEPADRVVCEIVGKPPKVATVSVTKYPTSTLPNWQTWQIGRDAPEWFSVGTTIKLVAGANQSLFVRGVVTDWDSLSRKFRIDLVELGGDVTPYNSWFMSLDGGGNTAKVSKASIVCEYVEIIPEQTPVEEEPQSPQEEPIPTPKPKKRRIMM